VLRGIRKRPRADGDGHPRQSLTMAGTDTQLRYLVATLSAGGAVLAMACMNAASSTESDQGAHTRWATTADLHARIVACGASGRTQPFVTLTYAQSLDGSISAVRGTQLRLSGATSMTMTHVLRAMHDGILVGVNTVVADNPSLTVRLTTGTSPRPLILDSHLRCPLDCKLMSAPTCVRPILFTTVAAAQDPATAVRRRSFEAAGAVIVGCAATPDGRVDFADVLRRVPRDIRSIMVEGGAAVISNLLSTARFSASDPTSTYIDYALLTIAPVLVRCHDAPVLVSLAVPTRAGQRLDSLPFAWLYRLAG
jgi:riboflavin-specific deaminase-like protein